MWLLGLFCAIVNIHMMKPEQVVQTSEISGWLKYIKTVRRCELLECESEAAWLCMPRCRLCLSVAWLKSLCGVISVVLAPWILFTYKKEKKFVHRPLLSDNSNWGFNDVKLQQVWLVFNKSSNKQQTRNKTHHDHTRCDCMPSFNMKVQFLIQSMFDTVRIWII